MGVGNACFAQAPKADSSTTKAALKPATTTAQDKAGKKDTVVKKAKWAPIPKKAGLYAALLPGLGQIYNRQYWKIPIVYAGFAVGGYFVVKNSTDYTKFRKAYVGRFNDPTGAGESEETRIYSQPQLKQLQDDASRFLNLSVLFTSIGYAFQVLDAVTSAHLRNFDISRDISMQVTPIAMPGNVGIGLAVNF